jgi:A/G-specific adenine glycosylase
VLLSELLLQRTTSKAVARIFPRIVRKYPTLRRLAEADIADLEGEVSVLGLRKQRRGAFEALAAKAKREFRGGLPSDPRGLMSIPHVGPYSAGAVLSFGFGKKAAIADSNVERIFKRVFANTIANEKPDNTLMLEIAERLVPDEEHAKFNYGILDLGAMICKYNEPFCRVCPICKFCDTGSKNLAQKWKMVTE